MTETHTYPDGSQVIGAAPFPELSPVQRAEIAARERSAQEQASMQRTVTFEFEAPLGCHDEIEAAAKEIAARYIAAMAVENKAPETPRRGRPPKAKAE